MKYFTMQKTLKNANLQFCSKFTTHHPRKVTTNINTLLYTLTSTSDILPPTAELWGKISSHKRSCKDCCTPFSPIACRYNLPRTSRITGVRTISKWTTYLDYNHHTNHSQNEFYKLLFSKITKCSASFLSLLKPTAFQQIP